MKPVCGSHIHYCCQRALTLLATLFLTAAFSSSAMAAATGQGSVINWDGGADNCMQDNAGFALNCTANDVRVSGIADINGDGATDEGDIQFAPVCDALAQNAGQDCSSDPGICLDADGNSDASMCGDRCAYPGDTTQFSTTFIFELSAQERYDVGAYFETALDSAKDGALTGHCAIITLPEDETAFTRPDGSTGNFVDLDTNCKGGKCPQPDDLCGDIDNANNPIYYDMKGAKTVGYTITATCIDDNNDGLLDLPSCTSWRQSGANEVCTDGNDAFPGSPSKCNCDPDFGIPIDIPPATIKVDKVASPTEIFESVNGTDVKFTVTVTNQSPFAEVTLNSLIDNPYGDITQVGGSITATDCKAVTIYALNDTDPNHTPKGSYTCAFTATVKGTAVQTVTDVVTVKGVDENGNPVEDDDDAQVKIKDVPATISITKTPTPGSIAENGGTIKYDLKVTNTSTVDTLEVTSLVDDKFGLLAVAAGVILDPAPPATTATNITCSLPQTLAPKGTYSCSFNGAVTGNAGDTHVNTVEVIALDDDLPTANKKSATAMATVNITGLDSSCTLTKTARGRNGDTPLSINEPGKDVIYDVYIKNTSVADTITLTSLGDYVNNVLQTYDMGTCAIQTLTLTPNQDFSCSFTAPVSGKGGTNHNNMVKASGTDDDNESVACSDTETVKIVDVPPTASLVKTATQMDVTYKVKVTNDSSVEALYLDKLVDDKFGDLTNPNEPNIISTTCSTQQTIAIGGNYECSFVGRVTTSPHVNKVTGTVLDDEGGSVTPSDDEEVRFFDPSN